MIKYATGTLVSPARSKDEIERTLKRFGASDVLCVTWRGKAAVMFDCQGKRVRITADLPTEVKTPKGRQPRHPDKAFDQADRQIWRALLVTIKGQMTAVEAGIKTFEAAFMGDILLPNGRTVAEWAVPQIEAAYESGAMPAMLFLPAGD